MTNIYSLWFMLQQKIVYRTLYILLYCKGWVFTNILTEILRQIHIFLTSKGEFWLIFMIRNYVRKFVRSLVNTITCVVVDFVLHLRNDEMRILSNYNNFKTGNTFFWKIIIDLERQNKAKILFRALLQILPNFYYVYYNVR